MRYRAAVPIDGFRAAEDSLNLSSQSGRLHKIQISSLLMLWENLTHRPHRTAIRRLVFQIHLWIGIAIGLYVFGISVTGATLVLREEIEILLYPQLFRHDRTEGTESQRATPTMVLKGVQSAYHDFTISAIYSPTGKRDTFMVYINRNEDYRTAYADPVTGAALGEVPRDSFLGWVQDLHFNLLAGSTGRLLNGVGGLALLLLGFTGLMIWWPGVSTWKHGLTVNFRKNWTRIIWELHGATGFWTLALILMWGLTGAYFTFPQQYRSVVEAVSPTTRFTPPLSDLTLRDSYTPADIDSLAIRAVEESRGRELWGVDIPSTDDGAIEIVTATIRRDRWANRDQREFYFDRFSGELLAQHDPVNRTLGDIVMAWIVPLHFGTFAGLASRIVWLVLGLTPALLSVTGALVWWNRVLRNRWPKPVQPETDGSGHR